MLRTSEAKAIVAVVKKDIDCQRSIDSYIDDIVPDSWGIAGGLRNWGYLLTQESPHDDDVESRVCTGITRATVRAINRAIKAGAPALRNVARATAVHRLGKYNVAHTATGLQLRCPDAVPVMDWHATLNIDNPLIYRNQRDFEAGGASVPFADYRDP